MEIYVLHLKDLGDTESVIMNAVVLVLGECQIPMATYLRGHLPSYRCITMHWELTMLCHYKVITDGHTHTLNRLRGSTNHHLWNIHIIPLDGFLDAVINVSLL